MGVMLGKRLDSMMKVFQLAVPREKMLAGEWVDEKAV